MAFESPPQQVVGEREQTTTVIVTDHCLGAACPTTVPGKALEGSEVVKPHNAPRHGPGEGTMHHSTPPKSDSPSANCHLPQVELTNVRFSEKSSNQPGVELSNLSAFHKKDDNTFSPVRPPGLAEVSPGQGSYSYDYNSKIDERNVQTAILPDHTTVYSYAGKLSHWGYLPNHWNASSTLDTRFTAEEIVGADNKLVASHVKYLTPSEIEFVGEAGSAQKIRNVTMVDTKRECDGTYVSRVQTADGGSVTYHVNDKGQVIDAKPDGALTYSGSFPQTEVQSQSNR